MFSFSIVSFQRGCFFVVGDFFGERERSGVYILDLEHYQLILEFGELLDEIRESVVRDAF